MPSTEHPSETRVAAFSYWYQGEPIAGICKKLKVDASSIQRWIREGEWKDKRDRMHSESELYAVDSIVSNKNQAVGVFMERFPSIMGRCLESIDSDHTATREKKDLVAVMTGMLVAHKMMFPDRDEQDMKRVSGASSGPLSLMDVNDSD